MSKILKDLLESRATAQAKYEEFVTPLIEAGAELTDEQQTQRGALRAAVDNLDARIDEVEAEEKRKTHLAEVRATNGLDAPKGGPALEVHEPTTYGKGSPNSYFLDLATVSVGQTNPGYEEARARLQRASHEVAVEMLTNTSPEKRNAIRSMVAEEQRRAGKDSVRDTLKRYEALGQTGRGELRAGMDTGSGSGGSFATPVYQVSEYAPYREAGRAFADACNKQELPAYGMTVYIPHVTGPAGVANQATQNTGVNETDPTAGYLSGNLNTLAGEVTVSQQLLDRVGPGFQFDRMIFDQLNRDYAPKFDAQVLTAALAGAGTVAYTDSTGFHLNVANGTGGFYSKVSGAKSSIRKGAGTFLRPSHLFLDPARWEFISGWGDGQARPVVVPSYAGPFNAVAGGSADGDTSIDGPTGYRLNGLPVFTDANIPTPTAGADQAIVGDLSEVYVFEGAQITRALPQTVGGNLSVLLQLYSYNTTIVRYPLGVQTISGSGMATISF